MKSGKAMLAAGSVLCMGMFLAGLSFASDNSTGEILKATPDQIDVGKVAEGKTVEQTATIQNVGATPVEITNVKTS